MRAHISRIALVILAVFAALLPVAAPAAQGQGPVVVINEFVADNSSGVADNTGSTEDWIELHNTSSSDVDIAGWTINDGDDSFTFPSFTIAGNGFRVVFASGETGRTAGAELHLPFKLTADGEPLTLRDDTNTVSSPNFAAPGFPALPQDVSYGRFADGSLGFFTEPTPGAANGTGSTGITTSVEFSVSHGFYTSTQTIALDTATPSATIRYTLDGSTPSPTSGTVLSPGQTITISTTSTVRAIAYRSGWIDSTVETRTYLFTSDIVTQSASPTGWPTGPVNGQVFDYGMDPNVVNANQAAVEASLTAIPTLSIVTDQENLTDPSTGIYTNARSGGRLWERPASVELIDPTGAEPGFDINAGLRIRGGGSRRDSNPKHSLRLYFRDDYGDGELDYPLFGADGVDRFESVGLATGQNGSWAYRNPNDATWVRDPWARATQAAMGQPHTESRYYHVYLNGQYWGLYYSQERLSGSHGVEHFGGDEDDYDVVGGNWRSAATASDGTVDGMRDLYQYVSDLNVTNSEFAALDAAIDLQNLADYYLLHFFTGDWDAAPTGWLDGGLSWVDSNNWRAFRNRTGVGEAGQWIFFDHDSEFTLCGQSSDRDTDNTTPWNLSLGSVPDHGVTTPAWLHEALITHPTYRQIFRDSVAEHMQAPDGALSDAANQARFDVIIAEVTGAIDAESARWGDALAEPPRDRSDWDNSIAAMRQCATDRIAVVQSQLEADGLWPTKNPPSITPATSAVPFGTDATIDANGEPGTIWFTSDGADPRSATGTPSATAVEYTGPISLTAATTIQARVLDGTTWTPLATQAYTLTTPAGPVSLLLNEYNAVGGSRFLGGGAIGDIANGTDPTLGRVAGNGGDWFELVVLESGLDITGWTFEIWHLDNGLLDRSAALTVVANAPELAALHAGTILTISEDIADDTSWSPAVDDWHINLQANSDGDGAYFTAASQQNFAIDNDDTQIAIFDADGAPIALRTGEGTAPGASVNSEEVFKLESDPNAEVSFDSPDYDDGTSSTWGLPNVWGAGTVTQDLSGLRFVVGDVDCDGLITIGDALLIAQYSVGTRTAVAQCPIQLTTQIMVPAGDVDSDGSVDIGDALLVAQCTVGLTNQFCSE